jgi:hypothetical protein
MSLRPLSKVHHEWRCSECFADLNDTARLRTFVHARQWGAGYYGARR